MNRHGIKSGLPCLITTAFWPSDHQHEPAFHRLCRTARSHTFWEEASGASEKIPCLHKQVWRDLVRPHDTSSISTRSSDVSYAISSRPGATSETSRACEAAGAAGLWDRGIISPHHAQKSDSWRFHVRMYGITPLFQYSSEHFASVRSDHFTVCSKGTKYGAKQRCGPKPRSKRCPQSPTTAVLKLRRSYPPPSAQQLKFQGGTRRVASLAPAPWKKAPLVGSVASFQARR